MPEPHAHTAQPAKRNTRGWPSQTYASRWPSIARLARSAARARPWWAAFGLVLVLMGLGNPLVVRTDSALLDLLMRPLSATATASAADTQVIVAIDDASLQALGRWPWPRELHASLIERLRQAGSGAIGYDVLFAEPSGVSQAGDATLADAVARHGRVVLPIGVARSGLALERHALLPLPGLVTHVAGLGHTDLEPDPDALMRRVHLEAGIGEYQWETLPLVLARVQQRSRWARDGTAATSELPPLPKRVTPDEATEPDSQWHKGRTFLVPGNSPGVRQVSAAQVLNDPMVAQALRGAVVWVGVTAQGLGPVIAAPAAADRHLMSGVQWQAQVYEALVRGRLVQPLGDGPSLALNLLPLLLLALLQPCMPGRWRARGLWLLPLPTLASALVLVLWQVWVPSAALSFGLLIGWLLTRSRELKNARLDLQRERGHADATLQAITDSVVTVNRRGQVQYLNPSAERLSGGQLEQVRGTAVERLFELDTPDARTLTQALSECMQQRRVVEVGLALRMRTPQGERQVQMIASPVFENRHRRGQADEPVNGAVLALSDVTESLRAADQLQHKATHDTLTGLPNRALLADRLQHAVLGAQARQRSVAVLFIDLDRFKRINDSLGHRNGDTVLQGVAARLRACCRAEDTLARWGGDEFVVLLENVQSREAVAARATQIIEGLTREMTIDQVQVACGCSIGIAMAPQDGVAVDALMAMADTAMYRGKANGGKRFEFYAGQMPAWTREWFELETRLRHGLEEHSFVLHYQPQVNLKTGQLVGLEALLRWRQPDGELWLPARFLPVIEETGLILSVGEWVIREAVGQLASWRDQGLPLVPVSVNVSTRQCQDRQLVQVVSEALRHSAVAPALLKLEVTESTAMADIGHLRGLLEELRALGVQVAMDDFGTGFSSLSHLRNFSVDQIKIDPSFVHDISRDPNGAAIVRATIALAHGLGLPVVAEGVESQEQMDFLAEHQCDIGQGYLYARAQDSASVADLLRLSLATGTPMQSSLWRATPEGARAPTPGALAVT